jgi:hypothetical protein
MYPNRTIAWMILTGVGALALAPGVNAQVFRRPLPTTMPAVVRPMPLQPGFSSNPYIAQARIDAANQTAYGNAWNAYGVAQNNAYLAAQQGYNPGWFVNPWYPVNYPHLPYYPPYYIIPYSYSPSYGTGATNITTPLPQPAPPMPAYGGGATSKRTALDGFGVPTEDGAIRWPLAFRLLSPDKRAELLDPLQSRLDVAAQQAAAGRANPTIVRDARDDLDRLARWLRSRRLDLAEGSYSEADAFLTRIDNALRAMRTE